VIYLGRSLLSIRGTFRPVTPMGSGVNMPVSKKVLVPPAKVATLLITASSVYKRAFI
jgi:hypothetical protein